MLLKLWEQYVWALSPSHDPLMQARSAAVAAVCVAIAKEGGIDLPETLPAEDVRKTMQAQFPEAESLFFKLALRHCPKLVQTQERIDNPLPEIIGRIERLQATRTCICAYCGHTVTVPRLVIYATCSRCGTSRRVRGGEPIGNEVEDVISAALAWKERAG
ncbi:MAG: hypothetical protein ACTHU0_21315 [Kofleriaceae bacterium]